MRSYIGINDFTILIDTLDVLKGLGLLEPASYIVTWEKKPRLTINRFGNFEFTNTQEVYGVIVTFWDEWNNVICNRRFVLAERFQDDSEE